MAVSALMMLSSSHNLGMLYQVSVSLSLLVPELSRRNFFLWDGPRTYNM